MKTRLLLWAAAIIACGGVARVQALDPTAQDQHLLELVNRMRMNPAAELPLLTNSADANVQSAINSFHVDLSVLAQQWATLVPVPPLAWNAALYNDATNHSQKMLDFDQQSHQLPGEPSIGQRATDAGYDYSIVGESIYAYAKRVFHAHAAWAIDWGNTANGIQNPPGHRENIMDVEFRELGVGIVAGTGTGTNNPHVGPFEMTQEFGNRFDIGDAFLLGVAFQDLDSDGFYSEGEGLSNINVAVESTGGPFNTNLTTMTAGGYQVQVPAGTYNVTFSGGVLASNVVEQVNVTTNNVKVDLVLDAPPPPPSADLAVSKTDLPDPVGVGSNLTYTVTVTNKGPDTATSVTLTDTLPSSVTFVSASTGCGEVGGTVTCDLGSLANGGSSNIIIVVTTTTAGSITNTATVAGTESDSVQGNNTAKAITTVTAPVQIDDLTVNVTDNGITCTNTSKGTVCTGNGTLSLRNIGVEYGAGTFTLTSTCKVKPGKPTKCKLAGVLNLTAFNLGNTPSAVLGLYLSDDAIFDGSDVKLLKKEVSTDALEALFDKLKAFKIKGAVPAGTDLSGKYILVVIDTTGIVVESDDANNYAAFGPLP